jgi:hypothetical protein
MNEFWRKSSCMLLFHSERITFFHGTQAVYFLWMLMFRFWDTENRLFFEKCHANFAHFFKILIMVLSSKNKTKLLAVFFYIRTILMTRRPFPLPGIWHQLCIKLKLYPSNGSPGAVPGYNLRFSSFNLKKLMTKQIFLFYAYNTIWALRKVKKPQKTN